ncbi:MAG: DNA-processing protein DprA, partial [Elusimicrobia bacterium]|nr:DNA-processing protein DprA [Elusimicrobiota bacterium]
MSPGLESWLGLNAARGPGPDRLLGLAGRLGLAGVFRAGAEELARAAGSSLESGERLREALHGFDARRELEEARDLGFALICREEPEYPDCLKSIADAPLVLYAWGRLDFGSGGLAIVGTRRPTPYGRRMARSFAREASRAAAVVSGLARGIDTEAHGAALEAGGRTW